MMHKRTKQMQKKAPDLNKITASSASSLLIRADTTSRLAPFLSDSICLFPFFFFYHRLPYLAGSTSPAVSSRLSNWGSVQRGGGAGGDTERCGLQEQALFRNPSGREDSHESELILRRSSEVHLSESLDTEDKD